METVHSQPFKKRCDNPFANSSSVSIEESICCKFFFPTNEIFFFEYVYVVVEGKLPLFVVIVIANAS